MSFMRSVRADATRYTTRELSPETWPDFERLFSQGGGWTVLMATARTRRPWPA
jgi:hypothetical protein